MANANVYVSDRAGFCTGTLKNFSQSGLCISDLPRKVHPKNGYFNVIVSRGPMNFNMKVEQKWKGSKGLLVEVGTAISNVPLEWRTMVMQHEPRKTSSWSGLFQT